MKTLLTMVLTIGLSLTNAIAQDPPQRVTDCDNIEVPTLAKRGLIQQNFPQLNRELLSTIDISPEQWGRIKAERIKFGRVMKIARNDLGDSINVILSPEQQEAFKNQRKNWQHKGKMRWHHNNDMRRHRSPADWGKWNAVAKRDDRKEQYETSKPETKTESTAKD